RSSTLLANSLRETIVNDSPCQKAFRLARFLPPFDFGPVLRRALRRLAAVLRSLGMIRPFPVIGNVFNAKHRIAIDDPICSLAQPLREAIAVVRYTAKRFLVSHLTGGFHLIQAFKIR